MSVEPQAGVEDEIKEEEEEGWQDDQRSTIVAQERTGTKLCNACVKIFHPSRDRDWDAFYRHIEYFDILRRSASRGCELCNHVLRGLRACETEYAPAQELGMGYQYFSPPSMDGSTSTVWLSYKCGSGKTGEFYLYLVDERFAQDQSGSTSALPNFDLFKWWMSDCLTNHTKCTRFYDENYTPSRLLKISADADDVCRNVRLIETSNLVSNFPYMALSHCWGDCDFLNLTTENRSRLLSGFGTAELPKTFSDAICLTYRLGAEYLWIDSLCIIQNDEGDWETEAFSMKKVYSNAICTIAATAAQDPRQGLHGFEDDPNRLRHIPIECSWLSGDLSVGLLVGDIRSTDISDSPLLQRAWVIQEMALSPRKLHFAKSQIHWQCQERVASEALPLQYPVAMLSLDKHLYKWPENRGAQDSHLLSIAWWNLVAAYSHGNLTKDTDKFAAFAGAAEHFQKINGGLTYVCGMWRENMLGDLLWSRSDQRHPSGKSSQRSPRAPSWSWLSLDYAVIGNDAVGYDLSSKRCLVEVLDVAVKHPGYDDFGPITGAALQMKGLLKSLAMDEVQIYDDGDHILCIDDYRCVFELDDVNENIAGPVYCLPIDRSINSTVRGLLLKPARDDGGPDQLRRIAYFEAFGSSYFWDYQVDDGIRKPLQPTTFTLV